MRPLPPLNALRAFEAAARHNSFSRAAEELNVSHSAISRHVRGLEARLGVALFRDAPRGVTLTPEGQHYLARIAPAFDVIGAATEGLSARPEGRVILNCEPLFAGKVIAPQISKIHSALPGIDLHLIASTDLADLDRFEADMAIRFAHSGRLGTPGDLLSAAPIYPFAAPGLLPGDTLTPAQLIAHHRFRDRSQDLWPLWAQTAGWDLDLHPTAYAQRSWLALESTLAGAGLFLGASDATHLDEVAGRLVRVSDISLNQGAFFLLTSPNSQRRKPVRALRSLLLDLTHALRHDKPQPKG